MSIKDKSKREQELNRQIKVLSAKLMQRGLLVRREILSRGQAFRVKSGDCTFSGEHIVFIDRRLPADQQIAVLNDYLAQGHAADVENRSGRNS